MSILIDYINQIVPLNAQEQSVVEEAFMINQLTKGDSWVSHGQYCNEIAFVQSGKLRIFYIDESGIDITCFFVTDNNFIASFTSFLTQTPTNENIVAIEDTKLLTISRDSLEKLSQEVPKLQVLRRVIAENLFITMEKRVAALQSKTADQRYTKMLEENPDILLGVPLQYSASFMGITPQHLSRIRKNQMEQKT